ncbi:AraC family transcriptional regulator [Nonomuraea wenchangensis]|uniref:AraC family transcriptional regulator n=1 Tax=Nonomuraea wenchangensis TaxID=568860 RepID=UPI00343B1B4E
MYEERPPAPDLAARVACHWHQVSESGSTQFVVPDACVDLIWGPGGLFVAGPDTGPMPTEMATGDVFVGVRFRPGAASDLFGVPLHTLRDQRVPLSDLPAAALLAPLTAPEPATLLASTTLHPAAPHPRPALRAEPPFPATRTAPDLAARHATLTAATRTLLTHLTIPARPATEARATAPARLTDSTPPADPAAPFIARALRHGRSVSEVARDLGLSERQLRRRSLTAFGYAPKTLQRIVRFQRALRLARAGVPLATVAAEAGYADQAHLSHEVKRLSGVSLRTLAPPPSFVLRLLA